MPPLFVEVVVVVVEVHPPAVEVGKDGCKEEDCHSRAAMTYGTRKVLLLTL